MMLTHVMSCHNLITKKKLPPEIKNFYKREAPSYTRIILHKFAIPSRWSPKLISFRDDDPPPIIQIYNCLINQFKKKPAK